MISGEEEAKLTLLGVTRSLSAKPALVIDIGGGSTEVISPVYSSEISLPLGAVYLTDRFIDHDPPLGEELDGLRQGIRTTLDGRTIPQPGSGVLVGTAGTITTLASMDLQLVEYDPDRITGHLLTHSAVKSMIRKLSLTALKERRTIPGLEQGREDIILAGASSRRNHGALSIRNHARDRLGTEGRYRVRSL